MRTKFSKDIKTNSIAVAILLVVIGTLVAAIAGKVSFTDAGLFISTVCTALAGVGFFFTQDAKKGGTTDEL